MSPPWTLPPIPLPPWAGGSAAGTATSTAATAAATGMAAGAAAASLPPLTSTATDTAATYEVGAPTRPDIRHDNGFLQNPNDPNDPNPMPTRTPTTEDRMMLMMWRMKLGDAELIQGIPGLPHNDIPDGIEAYEHFLDGKGADRTFSYDRFVSNDSAGKEVLQNLTIDAQKGAEDIYAQMVARDPSLAGKPVTFPITGSPIPVGGSDDRFPYPNTENWQKAIGAHQTWTSAAVTVTPPATPGEKPQFSMQMTVHAEDRYNFNPGAKDISTGTPDGANGRLEQSGLAHQYMNYGTLRRDVSWPSGAVGSTTPTGGGTGGSKRGDD